MTQTPVEVGGGNAAVIVKVGQSSPLDGMRVLDLLLPSGQAQARVAVTDEDLAQSYHRVPPPEVYRCADARAWRAFVEEERDRFVQDIAQGTRYLPRDPGRVLVRDLRVDHDYTVIESGDPTTTLSGGEWARVTGVRDSTIALDLSAVAHSWLSSFRGLGIPEYPLLLVDGAVVGMIVSETVRGLGTRIEEGDAWIVIPPGALWENQAAKYAAILANPLPSALRLVCVVETAASGEFLIMLDVGSGETKSVSLSAGLRDGSVCQHVTIAGHSTWPGGTDAAAELANAALATVLEHQVTVPSGKVPRVVSGLGLLRLGMFVAARQSGSADGILCVAELAEQDPDQQLADLAGKWLLRQAHRDPSLVIAAAKEAPAALCRSILDTLSIAGPRLAVQDLSELRELALAGEDDRALAAMGADPSLLHESEPVRARLVLLVESDVGEVRRDAMCVAGNMQERDASVVRAIRTHLTGARVADRVYAAACLQRMGLGDDLTEHVLSEHGSQFPELVDWAGGADD